MTELLGGETVVFVNILFLGMKSLVEPLIKLGVLCSNQSSLVINETLDVMLRLLYYI